MVRDIDIMIREGEGGRRRAALRLRAWFVVAACALSACGGTSPPPQPGQNRGIAPDLRGRRVIVLPVQLVQGVPGDVDAELAFTLRDRGREVAWVFEDEIEQVLARAPAVRARTRGLPVGVFLQAEVQRVGDPLFGEFRRLGALMDAEVVLLPVEVSFEANQAIEGAVPKVRLTVVLVSARTGHVIWFGIEEGGEFSRQDPRGLASAVENLARTMLWYVRS